jgi:hypothetical protein
VEKACGTLELVQIPSVLCISEKVFSPAVGITRTTDTGRDDFCCVITAEVDIKVRLPHPW